VKVTTGNFIISLGGRDVESRNDDGTSDSTDFDHDTDEDTGKCIQAFFLSLAN
jgi:hypothetical protein